MAMLDFANLVNSIENYAHLVLWIAAGYYLYLTFKGGDEGTTASTAWGVSKEGASKFGGFFSGLFKKKGNDGPEDPSDDGGVVPKGTKKKTKRLLRKLYRVLRRVYRYHRKVDRDFGKIEKSIKDNKWDDANKAVKNALKFESKDIKFEALEKDLSDKVFKEIEEIHNKHPEISDADVKTLGLFRNRLKKDMGDYSKGLDLLNTAITETAAGNSNPKKSKWIETNLPVLRKLSKKIVGDILALEVEDKKLAHADYMK
jgi:hypothetical protein